MTSSTLDSHGSTSLIRPFVWTLPLARRTFRFVDLPPTDVARRNQAFSLVCDAARRSDNVGSDEFPSFDFFDWVLSMADDVIGLYDGLGTDKNDADGELVGVVIVGPCRYIRSCHPSNCSVYFVTNESIGCRLVWRDLARLGFEIGTRGKRCYTGCTIDVFVPCFELVSALREEGFVITACIPDAGVLTKFPGRHIDNYIMYKELSVAMTPLQLETRYEEENNDEIPDDVNLLTVPYLPIKHVLADGTHIIIRGLRGRDEIRPYYDTLKAAIAKGAGYGLDELPSIGFFVRWYVTDFYNVVYELDLTSSSLSEGFEKHDQSRKPSGNIIAYSNFGPSLFNRSVQNAILSDGNIVMLPEFRGRHWAAELHDVQFGISFDVGYRRVLGETSTKNMPSMLTMRQAGVILTGSIPRGIYFRDLGWTDLVTLYSELKESHRERLERIMNQRHQLKSKI